ncbi:MAG: hypothetical protein ACI4LK_09175 [Lentihominibacter sp.]
MRYVKGKFIVLGDPTLAWAMKMMKYNLAFICKDGVVYAEFERPA